MIEWIFLSMTFSITKGFKHWFTKAIPFSSKLKSSARPVEDANDPFRLVSPDEMYTIG